MHQKYVDRVLSRIYILGGKMCLQEVHEKAVAIVHGGSAGMSPPGKF